MKPPDSAGPGKTFVALRELNVFHKGHSRMFGKIAPAVCLGKIPALVRETAEADYLDFRNARAFYTNNFQLNDPFLMARQRLVSGRGK